MDIIIMAQALTSFLIILLRGHQSLVIHIYILVGITREEKICSKSTRSVKISKKRTATPIPPFYYTFTDYQTNVYAADTASCLSVSSSLLLSLLIEALNLNCTHGFYVLNVCVPSKFMCGSLIPNVIFLRGGDLWEVISS